MTDNIPTKEELTDIELVWAVGVLLQSVNCGKIETWMFEGAPTERVVRYIAHRLEQILAEKAV